MHHSGSLKERSGGSCRACRQRSTQARTEEKELALAARPSEEAVVLNTRQTMMPA